MARAATLLWIGLTCAGAVAAAQPAGASEREQASAHFDRGLELIMEGSYGQAVAQFERAYELSGEVAVLHNLGMAYAAADRPVEAASTLARYLEESVATLAEAERARIEAVIERQRARIGYVEIQVEPAGSSIEVDGRDAGSAPLPGELPLAIGEHRIEVSRAGYQRASWAVTVTSGRKTTLLVSLRPIAETTNGAIAGGTTAEVTPAAPVTAPPPERPTPEMPPVQAAAPARNDVQRVVGYVLGGAGIAAGVAAVALVFVSESRFEAWQREHGALELLRTESDAETEQRRKDNDALLKSVWQMDALTWALAIGSGALLLGSAAVLWTAPDSDRVALAARPTLHGGTLELAGRF